MPRENAEGRRSMTRDFRDTRLFSWRAAIASSDLPASVRHVALTLSLHMNRDGGSCFPSLATLAKETGRSRATIARALNDLEGASLLRRWRRGVRRMEDGGVPNQYQALFPPSQTENGQTVADGERSDGERPSQTRRVTVANEDPDRASPATGGRHEVVQEDVNIARPARSELLKAVATACGMDAERLTKASKSSINAVVEDLDSVDATPDEILRAASAYHSGFQTPLTPAALAKHFPQLRNGHIATGGGQVLDSMARTLAWAKRLEREKRQGTTASPTDAIASWPGTDEYLAARELVVGGDE